MIRNTTDDMNDPLGAMLFLPESMRPEGPAGAIEAMEKRGQTELVNSDRLPADTTGTDDGFLAVGFTFGEPDRHDPLFRPATLPEGWTRQPSDHAMWSYIVDRHGQRRVAVFYKAAHYDRRAHMRLITVEDHVAERVYADTDVTTDPDWATPEAVADAARSLLADRYGPGRGDDERARQRRARLEALTTPRTA